MAETRTGVSFRQVLGGRDQDRCQFQAGVGWQGPGQLSVSGRCWVAGTRTGVKSPQVFKTPDVDQDGRCYQAGGLCSIFGSMHQLASDCHGEDVLVINSAGKEKKSQAGGMGGMRGK